MTRRVVWMVALIVLSFVARTFGEAKVLVSLPREGIRVNGDLSDWDLSSPVSLNKKNCFMRNGYVRDDADCSAELYSNFSHQWLYFAVKVRDNSVLGPQRDPIFGNDGIELWLDCSLDGDISGTSSPDYYQVIATYTTASKDNPPQPGFWAPVGTDNVRLYAGSRQSVKRTADGYIMEIALPIKAFHGLNAIPGTVAGFNVSLCDCEPGGLNRVLWSGRNEEDARQFGFLTFGKLDPTTLKSVMAKAEAVRQGKPKVESPTDKVDPRKYQGPPKILGVAENAAAVGRYEKFEATVDLRAEFDNPFDLDDLLVQGHFTAPSGRTTTVDGFYYQKYSYRIGFRDADSMTPRGEPTWAIRFAPTEIGTYAYRVTVRDKTGRTAQTEPRQFAAVASDCPGFLRVSRSDPYYLEFDNGTPFYGIGYGAHQWRTTKVSLRTYKHHLNQIAWFGGNYLSVNMGTATDSPFNLETASTKLGHYDLEGAGRLDYILDAARRRGIYIIPNLVQTAIAHSPHWSASPFNKALGGPCASPVDFFSDPEARRLIRQRLRYTVARWGYSPNLLGWELVNEVNYCDATQRKPETVRAWHREMARYLKAIDPNRHLASTCFGSGDGCEDPAIWRMPEIDYTVTHSYPNDPVAAIKIRMRNKARYDKPTLGGEFGLKYKYVVEGLNTPQGHVDPEGRFIHDGLWVCAMTRCAGNTLFWWDSEYHDSLDLYDHFRAFAAFARGVPWPAAGFEPVELRARQKTRDNRSLDLVVRTSPSWRTPEYRRFLIDAGAIWGITHEIDEKSNDPRKVEAANTDMVSELPALLFGATKPEFRRPLIVSVDCPQPTHLELPILAVAVEGTTLNVKLNDATVKELKVVDRDGEDDPLATELAGQVSIPLAAGRNTLTVTNSGRGWVRLGDLRFKEFSQTALVPDLTVLGMRGRDLTLLWFRDDGNNWLQQWKDPKPLRVFQNVVVQLDNVTNGTFQVEWWDTYKGKPTATRTIVAEKGVLVVPAPPFTKDIACKIRGRFR